MRIVILFLLLISNSLVAQMNEAGYLEDQFYLGITYNVLVNKPDDVVQRNFSYGINAGYIKDMPLNSSGTRAVGVGLGYAVNSYYSNLKASQVSNVISYVVLDDASTYNRNKIENHLIELPIEYRWRKSTSTEYKFFRIYTGVKLGYAFSGRSKYVEDGYKESFKNIDIEPFQYGLTFNIGYNALNIHMYYAFSNLFKKDVAVENTSINTRAIQVGFVMYML